MRGRGDCGLASGTAHHPRRAVLPLAPGDQTAPTLRAVSRLALRQTGGLVGSGIGLLGLALAVPDHSTLGRRAKTLQMPCP